MYLGIANPRFSRWRPVFAWMRGCSMSLFKLTAQITGQTEVLATLYGLTQGQQDAAARKAVMDAVFLARRGLQDEIRSVFDRPTNYIVRSPRVKPSTGSSISAWVEIAEVDGNGVQPEKILAAEAYGGSRRDKRSEVLLRAADILPNGYQTALPQDPFPGSVDGNGNIRGPFLVQLLSYFQTFVDKGRGHRNNMTDARKQALRERGTGKKTAVGPQLGRRYIVAYGKLRSSGRSSNLAPGIWAVMGTTGAVVKPVLMFVRKGNYKVRLDMDAVAKKIDLDAYLEKRLRYQIYKQAGV